MTSVSSASSAGAVYRQDQAFFTRLAIGISVFTVLSFTQWALRGFANYAAAPVAVHVHAIAMLGWLGLWILQGHLAGIGSLQLHRTLGRVGIILAFFIAYIGTQISVDALRLGRVPPVFTDPYFLVMGPLHAWFFLATVIWAVIMRRDTQWHRRLMLAATVVALEPPFGRIVPIPILASPWGPWVEMLLQTGVLGIAMVHDRRVRGSIHPALWWGVAIVALSVTAIVLLSRTETIARIAAGYAGS